MGPSLFLPLCFSLWVCAAFVEAFSRLCTIERLEQWLSPPAESSAPLAVSPGLRSVCFSVACVCMWPSVFTLAHVSVSVCMCALELSLHEVYVCIIHSFHVKYPPA